MKKIYIKPTVIVIDDVLESSILQQSSTDIPEDPGNQGVTIPGEDEDFDPSMGTSKGDEFDPWDWSFRDDLLW